MVLGKVWLCLFTADFWKGSYLGRSGWGVSAKFRGLQAAQLFREDRGNQAKGRETRLRVGPVDDDIGPFGCAANSRKVACVSWMGLAPQVYTANSDVRFQLIFTENCTTEIFS